MIYKSTFSFVIVVAIRVFSGVRIRGVRQFAGVSEKRTTSRVWGNGKWTKLESYTSML